MKLQFMTTTQYEDTFFKPSPLEEERAQQQIRDEAKFARMRENRQRVETTYQLEDQIRQQNNKGRLEAKTKQINSYLEQVAQREARGGIF
jgi:hypothetical protein